MLVGLRPRLGERRPLDHRAIHEPNYSEDGCGPDGKLVLSKEREQRPMLKA